VQYLLAPPPPPAPVPPGPPPLRGSNGPTPGVPFPPEYPAKTLLEVSLRIGIAGAPVRPGTPQKISKGNLSTGRFTKKAGIKTPGAGWDINSNFI
jgi:hypothetical protein